MTCQELHQAFESRAQNLEGFIYRNTNGDEDLIQEAREAVWLGLQKDASASDAYLRTRIRWRNRDVWRRGRSIDTHRSCRVKAHIYLENNDDAEDELLAECMQNSQFPLDEQVINKVDSERFLNTLDMTERAIVLKKLEGMTDREVIKDLGMTRERYGHVKDALRPKIEDYFTSK